MNDHDPSPHVERSRQRREHSREDIDVRRIPGRVVVIYGSVALADRRGCGRSL
jgi:hypothetical protein